MTQFEGHLRTAIGTALTRDPEGHLRDVNAWQVDAVLAAVLAELSTWAPILTLPQEADPSTLDTSKFDQAMGSSRFLVNLPAPMFAAVTPKAMPDGSIVINLPPDGALVRHRHIWQEDAQAATRSWTGGAVYHCAFKYLDGSTCGELWATYGHNRLPDWGERWFTSGPYVEPAEGDLFDRIEAAVADYRYRHRLAAGDLLNVVTRHGMNGLRAAAGARGLPVVSDAAIIGWLGNRNLALIEVGNVPGIVDELTIYKPGTWHKGPVRSNEPS